MDEYKELFYSRINHKLGNYGDVSARIELRRGLECRLVYIHHIWNKLKSTYVGNHDLIQMWLTSNNLYLQLHIRIYAFMRAHGVFMVPIYALFPACLHNLCISQYIMCILCM